MPKPLITLCAFALATSIGASGCASGSGSSPTRRPSIDPRATAHTDGRFFALDEIRRTGARSAWEALARLAPSLHLRGGDGGQRPSMRQRAPSAIRRSGSTLVVLDGMRIPDLGVLRDVPASEVFSIHVLPATSATILYGNDGWNGAIVVKTILFSMK